MSLHDYLADLLSLSRTPGSESSCTTGELGTVTRRLCMAFFLRLPSNGGGRARSPHSTELAGRVEHLWSARLDLLFQAEGVDQQRAHVLDGAW